MTDAQGANAELSAKRAQWQEWARQQFSGNESQVQAAADAALRAALAGASSQEAAAAAREAAVRAGATPVEAPSGGRQPAPPSPAGGTPMPSGDNAPITRPSSRVPWYRKPLVLLTIAGLVVVLIGVAIWAISLRESGPSTPQTSVVPTTSTSNPTTTTKRTRKPKTTSSTSPTTGAASTGGVTITIP